MSHDPEIDQPHLGEPTTARQQRRRHHRSRTPLLHRYSDGLTEALLYFSIIFGPWAFGTVHSWAIWTMNITGYLLGAFLATKWIVRWKTGFRPERWGDVTVNENDSAGLKRRNRSIFLTRLLAALTVLILTYIFVHAVNARATYNHDVFSFEYHDNFIKWLPHSYDSTLTWQAFWTYLALAFFFWAVRDWLQVKSRREKRDIGSDDQAEGLRYPTSSSPLPSRLSRLLWVLCINASILALVSILHRLDDTENILWIPELNYKRGPEFGFGPFGYRGNAGAYFNLIWPISLVFLYLVYTASRTDYARARNSSHYTVLIPMSCLLIACPIVSSSRAAAAICCGVLGLVIVVSFRRLYHTNKKLMAIFLFALVGSLSLGVSVGWENLRNRFQAKYYNYPVDEKLGNSGFSIRCSFVVPSTLSGNPILLAGVAHRRIDGIDVPHSLIAFIDRNGDLVIRRTGYKGEGHVEKRLHQFAENRAGSSVDLIFAKGNEVAVWVNGARVDALIESQETQSLNWLRPFPTRFLCVGRMYSPDNLLRRTIQEVSLYNAVLTEDDISDQGVLQISSLQQVEVDPYSRSIDSRGELRILELESSSSMGNSQVFSIENGRWEVNLTASKGPLSIPLQWETPFLKATDTLAALITCDNSNAFDIAISLNSGGTNGRTHRFSSSLESTGLVLFPPGYTDLNQPLELALEVQDLNQEWEPQSMARVAFDRIEVSPVGVVQHHSLNLNSLLRVLEENLNERKVIYTHAISMIRDNLLFGVGPGAFESVYQLYRNPNEHNWAAWAHNDYLETQATFGFIGALLSMAILSLIAYLSLGWTRSPKSKWVAVTILLALMSCLLHSLLDFPLQIYSIVHLFTLSCAILISITQINTHDLTVGS